MSSVTTEFVKQLIVTLLKKFVESWNLEGLDDSSYSFCCGGGTRRRDVGQTL